MADIVFPTSPHIDRPFGWKTWRVTPGTLTGTTDVTVATLPADTVILDAKMAVVVAEAGATTSTVDIEIGATGVGDTTLLTGGADWSGTLGNVESAASDANLATINAVSLGGSDLVVNAEIAYSGTATTAPTFEVSILCGRTSY